MPRLSHSNLTNPRKIDIIISFSQTGKLRTRNVRRWPKFSELEMDFRAADPRVCTPSHYPSGLQMRSLQLGGANGVAEGDF